MRPERGVAHDGQNQRAGHRASNFGRGAGVAAAQRHAGELARYLDLTFILPYFPTQAMGGPPQRRIMPLGDCPEIAGSGSAPAQHSAASASFLAYGDANILPLRDMPDRAGRWP